jgi:hypothetical protein
VTPDATQVRLALRRAAGRTSAAVAVRTTGEPCGAGTFVVPSASTPGHSWTVFWVTEGTAHCFCAGFAHRGTCRHLAAVALAIEVEARQSLEQTTPAGRAEAAAKLAELAEEFAR